MHIHWKKSALSILLLFPAAMNATQSLSAGSGSGTLPSGAPWTNLSNYRIEFRLHNWTANGSYQWVEGSNAYASRIAPNGSVFFTSWRDGSLACYLNLTSGGDAIIRFQRDSANSRITCEAYSSVTGSLLGSATTPITAPGIPNDSGSTISVGAAPDLAYVRGYSTVVPVGTEPGNTYTGDLFDYELNGNGTDQTHHANLALSGASFVTTPSYPPGALFNTWPSVNTFRAGTAFQLNAASSFSATDNATLSYFWQQLSGAPMLGTFSSRTIPNPTFSATIVGGYPIQLTATDQNGLSASTSTVIGAVATDSNNVVVTGLPQQADYILGPLTMSGTSPWIYFDLAEIGTGNSIAAAALANPPALGPPISGTVTLTSFPIKMVGTGTHFTTELSVGQQVIVAWDSIDGPGTGRYVDTVTSITDDTHAALTLWQFYPPDPAAAKVYSVPANTATSSLLWWQNGNISTFWNFYDVALALYRLYYRTGNPAYLNEARQYADYNWQWMTDHGYGTSPPRGTSLLSQFFRALDGHPERLPQIYKDISILVPFWLSPSSTPNIDLRESGYMQWFTAIGSRVDSDAGRHAQYCSWLNTFTPQWIAAQSADGHWGENVYSGNNAYPYPPLSISPLIYGASPWRTSILVKALEATYDSLKDTTSTGCDNPGLAASLLTTIENAVSWQWNYGRDSRNRGVFYDTQYPGNAQSATAPAGTASVNLGSTQVVGSGTSFTTAYACNNTDFIGFNSSHTVYKVISCADATHLTISPAFGSYGSAWESSNLAGSGIEETPPASASCGASLAQYCSTGSGDLDLDRLVPGDIDWLYYTTGNTQYQTWADDFFSAAFGGPASGPTSSTVMGQYVSNPSGPNALGYIGDNIRSLPDCNAPNPPPCTPGGSVFSNLGKNFGEASGAPGADNALAWRINGLSPPVAQTVHVDPQLASVPNASQVSISVTQPSGVVTTETCNAPSCPVTVDARQGSHLIQKTYQSSAGASLARGDPTVLTVQP